MNEFPVVLVINCGSSSIKFSVLNASDCEVLMSGIADGINSENAFLSVNGGEPAPLAHHSYEGALKAIDQGHEVYGEVNIDQLTAPIQELLLTPNVPATREAVHAISEADRSKQITSSPLRTNAVIAAYNASVAPAVTVILLSTSG